MKRIPMLAFLLATACQLSLTPPTGTTGIGTTGVSGASGASGTTTTVDPKAVCDGGDSTCTKWLAQCKKDCKVIADATKRTACTEVCTDVLDACVSECKSASDPAKFDAKAEDFDGKPEPPKPTSDTCGGIEQDCCVDAKYDDCQEGGLALNGTDSDGVDYCACVKPCTKNLLDAKNKGVDDCDETHICAAQDPSKAASSTNKLFCQPAMCDPSGAKGDGLSIDEGCGYPQPRCTGITSTKPKWGICQAHCVPHIPALACSAGSLCYSTYTNVTTASGTRIMPLNVCTTKGAVVDGNVCTFTVTGDINAGFKAADTCAADLYCDLSGATKTCRTSCGLMSTTTGDVGADSAKCAPAGVKQKECSRFLSNITGIPAPSGQNATAWKTQLDAIAEDQGAMFYCKDTP